MTDSPKQDHPFSEGSIQSECKTKDDDYASGYADGLAGLPPMFTGGDRESYDHGYTDGFLSQCPR